MKAVQIGFHLVIVTSSDVKFKNTKNTPLKLSA